MLDGILQCRVWVRVRGARCWLGSFSAGFGLGLEEHDVGWDPSVQGLG
jgi:hypothetical protein